jgi:hypothetical protein
MRLASTLFLGFVTATSLLALAAGLSIMDNPQATRFKRLDHQRLQDLRALANAIELYRKKSHKLPETLEQLAKDLSLQRVKLVDLEQRAYVYRVKGDAAYELCAHFDMAADDANDASIPYGFQISAKHPAGDHCFALTTER